MEFYKLWVALLLYCAVCFNYCSAYKILLLPATSKSHVMYFTQLGKALESHGHEATIVYGSTLPMKPSSIRVMTYHLDEPPISDSKETAKNITELALGKSSKMKMIQLSFTLLQNMEKELKLMWRDTKFISWIKNEKFDFAIVESMGTQCMLPFQLDIPFATYGIEFPFLQRRPFYPSAEAFPMLSIGKEMTLMQRLLNFVLFAFSPLIEFLVLNYDISDYHEIIPESVGTTSRDIMSQASLFLLLRMPAVSPPKSLMPNMIDIGGIMGRPANKSNLPVDLKKFTEEAKDGFIIISFGSYYDMLPKEKLQALADAIAQAHLPVIWKSRASPDLPDAANVKVLPWIPQNDLLGHRNAKAFVTHCGVSSIQETLYHGVPIVGFPVAADQLQNCALLHKNGIVLALSSFTSDEFLKALKDVTAPGNEYALNAKKVSAIIKDLPDPGKTASYWISHVIKHGGGHLRSHAFDLYWYEFYSLDVIAILIGIAFLFLQICRLMCRKVCAKCSKVKTD